MASQLNSTKTQHIHPKISKAKLPEADVVRAEATDAETDKVFNEVVVGVLEKSIKEKRL